MTSSLLAFAWLPGVLSALSARCRGAAMTLVRCLRTSREVGSSLVASLAVLSATAASVQAEITTLPTSLLLGDRYYLAFVTSGSISGTSANVADYDAFVQAQANLNGLGTISGFSVTWKALVSTPSVNAITHLGLGNFPIFRLNDVQIASGGSDLWDGNLSAALNVDQFGTTLTSGTAWTGSQTNGLAYPGYQLGTSTPIFGGPNSTGNPWLVSGSGLNSNNYRVYAFSQQLIAVPEPTTISLAIGGGMATAAWTVRRRRRATGTPPRQVSTRPTRGS